MTYTRLIVVLAALLGILFVAQPGLAQGEDWLRPGYDPARTGAIPFEGPTTNDTAFQAHLPGVPTETVLTGDTAYVVTRSVDRFGFEGDTDGLDQEAVWSVDLATGETEKMFDLLSGSSEALLPSVAVVQDGEELVALEVPSGDERWRAQVRPDDPEVEARDYTGALAVGDVVYVEFSTLRGASGDAPILAFYDGWITGIMAVDLATGEVLWDTDRLQWQADLVGQDAPRYLSDPPRNPYGVGLMLAADDERIYAYGRFVTADEPIEGTQAEVEERQYEVWALSASSGQALWARNDTTPEGTEAQGQEVPVGSGTGTFCCGPPTLSPTMVHLRLDAFEGLNKQDGRTIWTSPAGRTDQIAIQGSLAMGVRGDALIATSPQSIYRLSATTGDVDWQKTDPDSEISYSTAPLTIDSERAYVERVGNLCGFGTPGLEARDLETGELAWEWHHAPSVGQPGCSVTTTSRSAFGPGVILKAAKDGTVTVIGETQASLGAPDVEEEMYPDRGEDVILDLSDTEPGVFGEASRFRVEWGDGTVTAWQQDGVFSHAYEEEGVYEARVVAGNEANQTNSDIVTMRVGEEKPTWLSERFAEGNQDMTFGVIGIVLALGGGVITVGRRYRKRSNLQRELEALEEGFEEARGSPSECEAFLDNRKARARSLALDGYLNEDQVGLVENRAEDLRGQLRVNALDNEFAFLPHGLVVKAREMVEDGDVGTLEREAFLRAVEEDEMLSEDQKAMVRERINNWHGRDKGSIP